jgi:hypothetical protein
VSQNERDFLKIVSWFSVVLEAGVGSKFCFSCNLVVYNDGIWFLQNILDSALFS